MNIFKITFIVCLIFVSQKSFALGPIYLDLHGSFGYGKSAVENESESPTTTQYGVGTTAAWKFSPFYAGFSADYYMVNQLTKPTTTFGNRKGKRTNLVSPTIGFNFASFNVKFDYQLMGNYKLDKETTSGEKISYGSPKGLRAYFGFKRSPLSEIGFFYESISYGEEKDSTSTTKLTDKLKISQLGLVWNLVL